MRAETITDEMCIAAARELVNTVEDEGLSKTHIVPTMDSWRFFLVKRLQLG